MKSLQYWEYNKELKKFFQSDPFSSEVSTVLISRAEKPSLFIASGSTIRGFTVKGKEFFKLDTSHTDAISFVQVMGSDLWSTGTNTLNCYASQGGKIVDNYFYLSDEKITKMDVCEIQGAKGYSPVLACGDSLRVISASGSLLYQVKMDSQVTCFSQQKEKTTRSCPLLVYGCKNGAVGAVEMTRDEAIVLWENSSHNKGAVTFITTDSLFTQQNIILSRESGEIEIYVYSEKLEADLVWQHRESEEAITGLAVGNITSSQKKEILYSCFSGAIKSICNRANARQIGVAGEEPEAKPETTKKEQLNKMQELQKEI